MPFLLSTHSSDYLATKRLPAKARCNRWWNRNNSKPTNRFQWGWLPRRSFPGRTKFRNNIWNYSSPTHLISHRLNFVICLALLWGKLPWERISSNRFTARNKVLARLFSHAADFLSIWNCLNLLFDAHSFRTFTRWRTPIPSYNESHPQFTGSLGAAVKIRSAPAVGSDPACIALSWMTALQRAVFYAAYLYKSTI